MWCTGSRAHLNLRRPASRAQPQLPARASLPATSPGERAGSGLGQPRRGALIAQRRAGGPPRERAPRPRRQETERGLLTHCHLGRAAATAWSLRPRPPPPSHPGLPPLSPPPCAGPSSSSRSPQPGGLSHWASIIYVTSTPEPSSLPAPAPPRAGAVRAQSALQLLLELPPCDVHKSRDTWQSRLPRATEGSAAFPPERPGDPWPGPGPTVRKQAVYTVLAPSTG